MEVYYREDDEVWVGDLSFIKLSEREREISYFDRINWPEKYTTEMTHKPYSSFISFDTSWRKVWPRKIVHLEDATIENIGISRITVRDREGNDYSFYTSKPEWVETTLNISCWAKNNKSPEQLDREEREREELSEASKVFEDVLHDLDLDEH